MAALRLIARATARDRWRSLLALAVVVALVSGVVFTAAAGARRTASSLDRFAEATAARDVRIITRDRAQAQEIAEELTHEPWVTSAAPVSRLVGSTGTNFMTVVASPGEAFASTVDRPLIVQGRPPRPDSSDEIVVDEAAVRIYDLHPGDEIEVQTMDPENFACAVQQLCELQLPDGAPVSWRVTGVFRDAESLISDQLSPEGVGSTAFYDRWSDVTGAFAEEVLVRLEGGANDVGRLRQRMQELAPQAQVIDAQTDYLGPPSDAVDILGTGLLVFALMSAAVGGLALIQAMSRQVEAARIATGTVPRVLGMTRPQQALTVAVTTAPAVVVGAALGALVAWMLSARFPIARAGDIEPDPGRRFDPVAHLAGPGLVAVGLVALAFVLAWAQARPERGRVRRRPPVMPLWLAERGADPGLIGGTRLAYEVTASRSALAVRSAVIGLAVGVAGLTGALVFGASQSDLVDTPAHWGWNWDRIATPLRPEESDQIRAAMSKEDGVAGVAVYRLGVLMLDGERVSGHALDGDVEPTLVDGTLPDEPTEVALGAATQHDLGVGVGDTVTASAPDGDQELDVVGTVVLPVFQDRQPDVGALVTLPALQQLSLSSGTTELVVRYDTGVDRADLEQRLSHAYAVGFRGEEMPARLANLDDSTVIVAVLAAFFAGLGLVFLTYSLVNAGQARRPMLAMLLVLGMRRSTVRRAHLWQAIILVTTGVLLGIPLGVLLGRLAWNRVSAGLGTVQETVIPWPWIGLVFPIALVAGSLMALMPAWLSGRRSLVDATRAE